MSFLIGLIRLVLFLLILQVEVSKIIDVIRISNQIGFENVIRDHKCEIIQFLIFIPGLLGAFYRNIRCLNIVSKK